MTESSKRLTKSNEMMTEEIQNLKDLLGHLESKNADFNKQLETCKKLLQEAEKGTARNDEFTGLVQTNAFLKQRCEDLEKRVFSNDIEISELKSNMTLYQEQFKKMKLQLTEETTKLENALKQEQIAHDQLKKDFEELEKKDKENEEFLMKEAKKSKRLNEEIAHSKDRQRETEDELRKSVELLRSSFGLTLEFTEENVDLKKQLASLKPNQSLTKGKSDPNIGDMQEKKHTIFDAASSDQQSQPQTEPLVPQELKQVGRHSLRRIEAERRHAADREPADRFAEERRRRLGAQVSLRESDAAGESAARRISPSRRSRSSQRAS